jgi:hypothetical protein
MFLINRFELNKVKFVPSNEIVQNICSNCQGRLKIAGPGKFYE